MLNEQDKNNLRLLSESDVYITLQKLSNEMILNWSGQPSSNQSEFQYLKENFERDGKIQGLKFFIKEVERISH